MQVLAKTIENEVFRTVGTAVAVEEDGTTIVVTGMIESDREREAIFDVIATIAPGRCIEDNLELSQAMPQRIGSLEIASADVGAFVGSTAGLEDSGSLEPGDFGDQEILTDPLAAAGAGATGADVDVGSEGGFAYAAPIDPVGSGRALVGGFQGSSLDSVEVEASVEGDIADEAIVDAVVRELREDAATAGLNVRVTCRRGVVRLRGAVPTLDDADDAAEVASRIPGVSEVREDLEVGAGRIRPLHET